MRMGKRLDSWLWFITAEDSSGWGAGRDLPLGSQQNSRETIRSIGKVALWYGTALCLSILINRLH